MNRAAWIGWAVLLSAESGFAGSAGALLASFDRYDVVAVADLRGVEQLTALVGEIAASPDFTKRGIEIVADFGSPVHQAAVDGYLTGKDVGEAALRTAVASCS